VAYSITLRKKLTMTVKARSENPCNRSIQMSFPSWGNENAYANTIRVLKLFTDEQIRQRSKTTVRLHFFITQIHHYGSVHICERSNSSYQ
jgi:hypothetical protein